MRHHLSSNSKMEPYFCMSLSRISILLPNRNHGSELFRFFDSIDRQTLKPDQLVIVDDFSTDNSREIIKQYARTRPFVTVLENEVHLGVAGSIQRALDACTSEFIFMASADEFLEDDALSVMQEAIKAFPEAPLYISRYAEWEVSSDQLIVPDHSSDHAMWYLESDDISFVTSGHFMSLIQKRFVWLGMNTAMIRRDVLYEVGGLDPDLKWHSDWFALYAIAFRYGFCATPQVITRFRLGDQSYSRSGMADRREQAKVVAAIQRKLDCPEFWDFRRCLLKAPVAMSTFMRPTILTLLFYPRYYGRLVILLKWWFGAVLSGRRRPSFINPSS